MIKGFTTIRFATGLSLAFLAFYSLFELYELWGEEEVAIRKIITFLILVICIALMYITESPYHIKRFIMGAGRYNELRHINQSGIPASRILSSQQTDRNEQRERPIKINRFEQSINRIKKYHSLKPADLFKQSVNISDGPKPPKTPLTPDRRPHRTLSLSMSPFNQDMNIADTQRRDRDQQLHGLLKNYKEFIAKSKSNEDWEQLNINRAKNIIGAIFRNEANRQIDNIQLLSDKLQNLFDIHIVDSKSVKDFEAIDRRSERQARFRSNIKLSTDKEVTFDQIFLNYQRGLLRQCGYKLRSKPAGDMQYRVKMISEMDDLIVERKKMDRLINYKQAFGSHSDRINGIQKLKTVARHFLQGKQLLDIEYRISDELGLKQFIIWVLSRHLNEMVNANLNEACVFVDRMSLDIDRKYTIKWLLAQTDVLVHYDVTVEKMDAQNRVQASKFVCKPGEHNIESVFVTYLNLLNQSFRNRIKSVPQLQSYMSEIM